MSKTFFITGSSGFIGFHLCKRLILEGHFVIGLDNMNDYYDVSLKKSRLFHLEEISKNSSNWKFIKGDLLNKELILNSIKEHSPNYVINLAAQAGVRYSIDKPRKYIDSNIVGFGNLLESLRIFNVEHFLYASSSSVYGGTTKIPFSENDNVDKPVSIYAATKKANELMAYSYSHLYGIPSTGLRFFTVYGPWGRPDMAPMIFTEAIINSNPIKIFNNGEMSRDFTYIDDVIESLIRLIKKPPKIKNNHNISNKAPHRILNIGNGNPIKLMEFVETLEKELNIKAIKIFEEMQLGDVEKTHADISNLVKIIDYNPKTKIKEGIRKFIQWYKYYKK